MKKAKKNYIPFLAGMATMLLLACLGVMSLAKEETPPAGQPQAQSQADPHLAWAEAGIALFGVERVAPGETLKAENGAELPAVLTYTDEKGEVHYYVEAQTVGDILDVCHKVTYRESLNCVDFGSEPLLDEKGAIQTKPNGEPIWLTGDVKCDIDYSYSVDSKTGKKTGFARGTEFTSSGGITASYGGKSQLPPPTKEEAAEAARQAEEWKQQTPLKPKYGQTLGMYTEADPAEVDMASWSGTAMKGQTLRSEAGELVKQSFAFTPYLGEYAVITLENTGSDDVSIILRRPNTVGNRKGGAFDTVRIPAGQTLVRAFRIDEKLPLENQLDLTARSFTDQPVQLTLTAEQYRFGVKK